MKITKRTLIEIFLVLIILFQGLGIYHLLSAKTDKNIQVMKDFMADMACVEALRPLYESDEAGRHAEVVALAEHLLENGYEGDTFVYTVLSRAYYAQGDIDRTIGMLEAALAGSYLCELTAPTEKGALLSEAVAHMQLSILYGQQGQDAWSQVELEAARSLGRESFGERYRDEILDRLARADFEYSLKER